MIEPGGRNAEDILTGVLFKNVFETTETMMLLVDENTGYILDANPAARQFFGYSRAELVKKHVFDLNPDNRDALMLQFGEMKNGNRFYFTSPNRLATGEIRTVEAFVSRLAISGRPVLLSIIHDITKRQLAEEALQERERRFHVLANDLPLGIYECDTNGVIFFVNDTLIRWFGYSIEEVNSGAINILSTVVPEHRQLAIDNTRAIMRGKQTPPYEYRALRKDGSTFTILIQSRPIFENGAPVGMRGTIVDITERTRIESAMQRSEKLESLGVLAGGIAHDFNNLLTGIFGFVDVARQHPDTTPAVGALLGHAVETFTRAKALTQQLLTFAKGGAPLKKLIDLATLVKNTSNFALSGSNVKASFDIENELWPCEADPNQISQVIDNIVINARQAMPLGGIVEIRMHNTEGVPDQLPAGRYVRIDIIDSGIGIASDILPRIFDPFFTTKQQGSGLGLATSYSIVKRHRGEIICASEISRGAHFTVFLPASVRAVHEEARPEDALGALPQCRILIMDDEASIRLFGQTVLARFGHTVTTAANAQDTVRLFKQARADGRPFDIVILDLTIPGGCGGCAVLEQLRAIDSGIRAIASSGYSNDPAMADPSAFGFKTRLSKPYLVTELVKALGEALQG